MTAKNYRTNYDHKDVGRYVSFFGSFPASGWLNTAITTAVSGTGFDVAKKAVDGQFAVTLDAPVKSIVCATCTFESTNAATMQKGLVAEVSGSSITSAGVLTTSFNLTSGSSGALKSTVDDNLGRINFHIVTKKIGV